MYASKRVFADPNKKYELEKYLNQGIANDEIAKHFNVCVNTILNEIQRGGGDLKNNKSYSADLAIKRDAEIKKNRKAPVPAKIYSADPEYVARLHELLEEGYSPHLALKHLEETGEDKKYKSRFCRNTIKNYRDRGLI